MRLGLNELGINKRYQQEIVSKNCPFCPSILEDDLHFLVTCPAYQKERKKYLPHIVNSSQQLTLASLLNDQSTDILRKLAMYIFYSFKTREEKMST